MPQKPLRHEKTMRNLSSCLQLNRVYDSWRALAYPSLKPLGAWFQDGSGLGFWRIWMYHFNSYVVKGCKMIVLSKTPWSTWRYVDFGFTNIEFPLIFVYICDALMIIDMNYLQAWVSQSEVFPFPRTCWVGCSSWWSGPSIGYLVRFGAETWRFLEGW